MANINSLNKVVVYHSRHFSSRQNFNQSNERNAKRTPDKPSTDKESIEGIQNEIELPEYVQLLNSIGLSREPRFHFDIDNNGHNPTVTMTLADTGEMVKKIPGDEFCKIAKNIINSNNSLDEHPGQWIELHA